MCSAICIGNCKYFLVITCFQLVPFHSVLTVRMWNFGIADLLLFANLYRIENFVYSMVKFGHSACTIMVCVTDAKCLRLCEESNFPCINFRYDQFHPVCHQSICSYLSLISSNLWIHTQELTVMPSALEQIGELKLFHIPKALKKGVRAMYL